MSESLKPCPWCGETPSTFTAPTSCQVYCHDCGITMEAQKPPHYLDKVVAAWNRRASPASPAIVAAVNALKDLDALTRAAALRQQDAAGKPSCNPSCTYKTSMEKPGSYICEKHRKENRRG